MADQTSKKKILIIEDDRNLQIVYKQKFTSEGYEVMTATTGNQALTIARENKPDLILLDIMLPEGMNGFDVMEFLKRDQGLKDIPVIMFTNLDSERETAIQMGAVDYVVKANTSIDELVGKVKTHLLPQ
jgi:two-component system alkaline phosphatase synthesis response regulator PhoP